MHSNTIFTVLKLFLNESEWLLKLQRCPVLPPRGPSSRKRGRRKPASSSSTRVRAVAVAALMQLLEFGFRRFAPEEVRVGQVVSRRNVAVALDTSHRPLLEGQVAVLFQGPLKSCPTKYISPARNRARIPLCEVQHNQIDVPFTLF